MAAHATYRLCAVGLSMGQTHIATEVAIENSGESKTIYVGKHDDTWKRYQSLKNSNDSFAAICAARNLK